MSRRIFLTLLFCAVASADFYADMLQVGGFVDTEACYQALQDADVNNNDEITNEEYVSLAKALSPAGLLDGVRTFKELPFAFTSTFRNLACLCQIPSFGGDATDTLCCTGRNAHVRVPEDPATADTFDMAYLYSVCYLTQGAGQSVYESPFPTSEPTALPTVSPTLEPTAEPTSAPTAEPTREPTSAPTSPPTSGPTATPTSEPTTGPTATPTSEPTAVPSAGPTLAPTATPTLEPTRTPVGGPTLTPSVSPTGVPTTEVPVLDATVRYQISVQDGFLERNAAQAESLYTAELLTAMDELALQVGGAPSLIVKLPTRIADLETIDCPEGLTGPDDLCQEVTAIVPLETLSPDLVPAFENQLFTLISEGVLQEELLMVNPDTPILVLTGLEPPPPTSQPPSSEPTAEPLSPEPTSEPPSSEPTGEPPTSSPSISAAPQATVAPTVAPTTAMPSQAPTERVNATVDYQIAVSDGIARSSEIGFQASYLSDLQASMDQLALKVGGEEQYVGRRRLASALQVLLPSDFVSVTTVDCSVAFATNEGDLCQDVTALIPLSVSAGPNETSTEFANRYRADLFDAIFDGELQEELTKIRSDTPVRILTGQQTTRAVAPESDSLSTGARAGIGISAVFVVLVGAALFIAKRPQAEDKSKREYAEYHGEDDSNDAPRDSSVNESSIYTDGAMQLSAVGGAATLGAAVADYGKKSHSKTAVEAMEAGEDLVAEPALEQYESSSNAGSSGWSSSAGISSLNTGSIDDSMDAAMAAGATLASMGLASGLRSADKKDPSSVQSSMESSEGMPSASREELDNLIEAGDWAAVGATAALLAAASDSQSFSSRSRATARSQDSGSIDAARAAELDNLVDAGDWEGVVLAAAKYQTAESDQKSPTAGASLDSSIDSRSGTGTGTAGSPSVSTSISDSPSKAAKRAEVRSEVEALVRRVVPEEIDNVDEMMDQFKGREDELVETLRTMQERAVAQKARSAGHKAAKVKAKQSVQRGIVPGADAAAKREADRERAAIAAGALSGVAASALAPPKGGAPSPKSSAEGSETGIEGQQTALEQAIEAGDWEAVGQAAALISDRSVGSGSLDSGAKRDRTGLTGEDAERASQVDQLINVGDWTGVIAASNRFAQADSEPTDDDEKAARMSQEEEEALKQAELWMKIADQKKAEGATDAGASDAAEWAIQRSLSQLKAADKKKQPADDEDEV